MRRSMFVLAGVAVLAAVAAFAFGVLGEGGGRVQAAHTVIAVARGDLSTTFDTDPQFPKTNTLGNDVENGDFTISCPLEGIPPTCPVGKLFIGNAIDEITTWDFNFDCLPTEPLKSARLTLTLEPKSLFSTDSVSMLTVGGVAIPSSLWAPPFITDPAPIPSPQTATVDLIAAGLAPAAIFGALPLIEMQYQDDAIVSFAKLELEPASCPVGGITELVVGGSDSAAEGSASGSSAGLYAAIAGVAAAVVAIAAGGWYARRRLLR